ncbi:MAG: ATP-dependent DNA helicase [Nanoarchaeota archaeon]|nr:ATP-dependent DNA helicase [Nanoarchaeota archaeon]
MKEFLFAHEDVRDIQKELMLKISDVVKKSENLIAHAPTGLGKTAAALGPCLKYALDNDLTIFFLTSRHTQHKIAIDTLSKIKKKHDKDFRAVSIIGKKGLCLQAGVQKLFTNEFNDYCRRMREDHLCEFFESIKKKDKLSLEAKSVLESLKKIDPLTTDTVLDVCTTFGVCPYEITLLLAKDARIIIGDYYYLFNPDIRNLFLKKIGKELKDIIIIIDEGHNIPARVKDLFTARLSNVMLKRAISEAKKFKYTEVQDVLIQIENILLRWARMEDDERYIKQKEFLDEVNQIQDYQEIISDFDLVSDAIREKQKQSYIGSVLSFLQAWIGSDDGFTRILSKKSGFKDEIITLSYRCLDPSLSTRPVIKEAHSTILMSGTLTPTSMYKELLGFEDVEEETYKSPFPEKNKLNIIIPKTTTKYTLRSQKQFTDIAQILATIINTVPGNSAIFFPSYYLRDEIYKYFNDACKKTIFVERAALSKTEKQELLENFKGYKKTGAVLLGVVSGSFGEGIDLPGDYLKAVVIVGLPLLKPDLESKALIEYYDEKFGKGWDYGYLFPAFNKTIQSAGRCIRSEQDKGVVIFLDERYIWPNYFRCFPPSWSIKTTMLYERMIKEFFEKHEN